MPMIDLALRTASTDTKVVYDDDVFVLTANNDSECASDCFDCDCPDGD